MTVPFHAAIEVMQGSPIARPSSTLFWMPLPMRIGATRTCAESRKGRISGTRPVTVTPGRVASSSTAALGLLPQIMKLASGTWAWMIGRTASQNQTTASTFGK